MEKNEIISALSNFIKLNKGRYEIIRIGVFGSVARDFGENNHEEAF